MIEATVISYLMDKTSAVKNVFAERPKNPPAKYIIVEKTGSDREDRVDRATIAIQSIAGTMFDAAALNEEVKAEMDEIVESDLIGACRLNSDYNFTDQTTKEYRYQAVFDITHY